jgi:hypothetical protein
MFLLAALAHICSAQLHVVVQVPDFAHDQRLLLRARAGRNKDWAYLAVDPATLGLRVVADAVRATPLREVAADATMGERDQPAGLWALGSGAFISIEDGGEWRGARFSRAAETALRLVRTDAAGQHAVVLATAADRYLSLRTVAGNAGASALIVATRMIETEWEVIAMPAKETPHARQMEYWAALRQNIAHPNVVSIHILWERSVSAVLGEHIADVEGKLQHFEGCGRMKYSTAVRHAAEHFAGDIVAIVHADIVIGLGVDVAALVATLPKNRVLSPVRHERDSCRATLPPDMVCDCRDHQIGASARCLDTHVFRSPLVVPLHTIDFYMGGLWGCEHLFVAALRAAGIDVTSPCHAFPTYHEHCSSSRPHQEGTLAEGALVARADRGRLATIALDDRIPTGKVCMSPLCSTPRITRSVAELDTVADECSARRFADCRAAGEIEREWNVSFGVGTFADMAWLEGTVHVYSARQQIRAAAKKWCRSEHIYNSRCGERIADAALRAHPHKLRVRVDVDVAGSARGVRRFTTLLDPGDASAATASATFCAAQAAVMDEAACVGPLTRDVLMHIEEPTLSVPVHGEAQNHQLRAADFEGFCARFADDETERCVAQLGELLAQRERMLAEKHVEGAFDTDACAVPHVVLERIDAS